MILTHDAATALQAAVALANTAGSPDTMTTIEDLDAYHARFRYTGRRDRDEAELEAVRALRPALRELLTSDRDSAAELVNTMLSEAGALPRLVRHDEFDWHLHATPDDSPLASRITVETAMAMIDVIRTDETSRLAVCVDEGCEGIVLDLSRNRSRRFCSVTCGNRNAAAAYRARHASRG